MKVKDEVKVSANHSIEWGQATWDSSDVSIRNRFETANGKFNKFGSSEIPWEDFKRMIKESISRDKFSNAELADFMQEIAQSIRVK